jgi:hypothetical protein
MIRIYCAAVDYSLYLYILFVCDAFLLWFYLSIEFHIKKLAFFVNFLFCVFWKKIPAWYTIMYHQKKSSECRI